MTHVLCSSPFVVVVVVVIIIIIIIIYCLIQVQM
jgi:hypothetical protein